MITTEKKRILIIEDEDHIAEGLKLNLSIHGFAVKIASDGVSGLYEYKKYQPDLIVLDIMLPGMNGLMVLKKIREEDERVPILILSAKNASHDKVQGLSFGVDDYMTKPFNLDEFLLRVERLILRGTWSQTKKQGEFNQYPDGKYAFGENEIFFRSSTAKCHTEEVHLTDLEIRLLDLFITNRGKVLSRAEILENVWGYDRNTTTRTVDNFIVRLRKYFEPNPKEPIFFKSLRSIGYIFDHD